jgi:putative endopeptidase
MNALIGPAMGKLFAEKFFPHEIKEDVLEIVKELFASIRIRISQTSWMSNETKKHALEKLDVMGVKIGYPDTWMDYSPLRSLVNKNQSFFEKMTVIQKWRYEGSIKGINKPVDKDRWRLTPQTVY